MDDQEVPMEVRGEGQNNTVIVESCVMSLLLTLQAVRMMRSDQIRSDQSEVLRYHE